MAPILAVCVCDPCPIVLQEILTVAHVSSTRGFLQIERLLPSIHVGGHWMVAQEITQVFFWRGFHLEMPLIWLAALKLLLPFQNLRIKVGCMWKWIIL